MEAQSLEVIKVRLDGALSHWGPVSPIFGWLCLFGPQEAGSFESLSLGL